jgi:hypothetical protein
MEACWRSEAAGIACQAYRPAMMASFSTYRLRSEWERIRQGMPEGVCDELLWQSRAGSINPHVTMAIEEMRRALWDG